MKDKKALLVLGASSDLGSEFISRVAENYEYILAHSNHGAAITQDLQKKYGDKIILLQADLSDPQAVNNMIQQIHDLPVDPDHIVHFAAPKTTNKKFTKYAWEDYAEAIEVSVHAFVSIAQEFLPSMQKQHYGKIVVMLTSCTCGVPPKYQTPYVSSKYMLLGLMRSLAAEYADKGITINGVSPDMIETKFLEDIPPLIIEKNAQENPLGRNIKIQDVIPAIQYLLSDGADAVTGQNIVISGGKII
ncbi:MAG: SDR family oxidoreductase [Bacteroidales bacterium]|nr:SDR family oxidoreductase [Bacteroidales bacterium]